MIKFKGSLESALDKIKASKQARLVTAPAPGLSIGPANLPIPRSAYAQSQVIYTQPQFYSPLHTPQNWQIPQKRREIYQWSRYFYENEPKVAAAIDYYSQFPINGFETQCDDSKIKSYYDNVNKKLNLDHWMKLISKEYYMLGDVFPFLEVECETCFLDGTYVLTDKGHRNITQIKVGDMVFTKEGKFEEVTKYMAFRYEGNIVSIKASSLPKITSTGDHKHYVVRPEYRCDNRVKFANWQNPIVIPASEIRLGDYLVCPFNGYLPETCASIIFDGSQYRLKNKKDATIRTINLTEDFAELIGWYVAEGSTDSNRQFSFSLNRLTEQEHGVRIKTLTEKYFGVKCKIDNHWKRAEECLSVDGYSRELSAWFDDHCGHGAENKRIPAFILNAPKNIKRAFIRGYWLGDGHERFNEFSTTTVSRGLCFDMISMLFDLGRPCFVSEKEECTDSLGIHRRHCYTVCWRKEIIHDGHGTHTEEKAIYFKVQKIDNVINTNTVYNITVDKVHNYVANMFHTRNCHGSGITTDGEPCNHPGGTFRRLVILNPDWIDVQTSPLAEDPVVTLLADDELRKIVWHKRPKAIYDKLPMHVRQLILTNRPIPLANESVSHLKYSPYPYGTYGTSLIRRLFKTLMYKDKLMTAQWIVAERLILPIRVVKVGDADRPAGPADIADVQAQLAQVANDPNLTLVTHHAFDYDWIGSSGKVLQVNQEFEFINKEVLQGLMINEALLSGEMSGYQSSAIGAEGLIQRMESWRLELARWVEDKIYKPIAQMKGFVDKEASKEAGEPVWIYPKIHWNDLNIRDDTQQKQLYNQLHDKGAISTQTLLEKFNMDYDQEIIRIRFETAATQGPFGQQPGGAAGGGGLGGMGGGGGMGAPPADMGGGAPPPDMGGAPGAVPPGTPLPGAGGGMPGGAPPTGGPAPMAGGTQGKVLKKGKGKEAAPQESEAVPTGVRLTSLEQTMWQTLVGMRLPFHTFAQYPLGPYKADFAIPQLKLAIEIDGQYWHKNPETKAHDEIRDQNLSKFGWTVVRFGETELKERMPEVKKTIGATVLRAWRRTAEEHKQQSESMEHKKAGIEASLRIAGLDESFAMVDPVIPATEPGEDLKDGQADPRTGNPLG
jgi:very-short-patch-repair endonuclease/intein/homing endonuclease